MFTACPPNWHLLRLFSFVAQSVVRTLCTVAHISMCRLQTVGPSDVANPTSEEDAVSVPHSVTAKAVSSGCQIIGSVNNKELRGKSNEEERVRGNCSNEITLQATMWSETAETNEACSNAQQK